MKDFLQIIRQEREFMTKVRQWCLAVLALAGTAAAVAAGRGYLATRTPVTSTTYMMDTVITQQLFGPEAEEAEAAIRQQLSGIEDRLSLYRESSEIAAINENAGGDWVSLSPETYALLERSVQFCQESQGRFDITVAPLTTLWDVMAEDPKVPPEEAITQAQALVDYRDLQLQDGKARLARSGQGLDLGAVAKGYACDVVRETTESYRLSGGYVSVGGNVVVLGNDPNGKPYRFGIRDPQGEPSEAIGSVALSNQTMATTGTYERYFEVDGKRYHHILDPKTGYPAESDLLSVTVISEDGTLADYLSTALFLEGEEAVRQHLDEDDYSLVVVTEDGEVLLSSRLRGNFENDPESGYSFVFSDTLSQ